MSQERDLNSLRSEFAKRYFEAESCIKHYELEESELIIPAINQLRYAGHHYAKSIALEEDEQKRSQLKKAINHCKRACYDAKEAILMASLEQIDNFFNEFETSEFLEQELPEYREIWSSSINAKEKIQEIRRDLYEDRDSMFELLDPFINKLNQQGIKTIPLAANRLAVKHAQKDEADKKQTRKFLMNFGLVILGILITLILSLKN